MRLQTIKISCNVFHRLWKIIQWFISKPAEAHTRHCNAKMWNLFVNLELFFLSFKENVVHWRTL